MREKTRERIAPTLRKIEIKIKKTVGRVLHFSDCTHMGFLENRAKINCKKFVPFAFRWEQIRAKSFILYRQSLAKIGRERETKTEKEREQARKKKNGGADQKGRGETLKKIASVMTHDMLAIPILWKQKQSLLCGVCTQKSCLLTAIFI